MNRLKAKMSADLLTDDLKNVRAELNESLLEQFHGTRSLHFESRENRNVAVKTVDDRWMQSVKIISLD